MPIKRSRTSTSCSHFENVEMRPTEQSSSSSAIGARNKSARTSMSVDEVEVVNPPIPPPPPPLREVIVTIRSPSSSPPPPPSPDQLSPPEQIQFHDGGGFTLHTNPMLPPTLLDACNYCKKRIRPKEDRYMSGGLEAYCSPACRENFNKMMMEAGKRSPEAESSMDHLQWNKKN